MQKKTEKPTERPMGTPAEYILTQALKEISVALKNIANHLELIENLQREILECQKK